MKDDDVQDEGRGSPNSPLAERATRHNGGQMWTDSWVQIRLNLKEIDEREDPWESHFDPWLAEVYQALFMRRRARL